MIQELLSAVVEERKMLSNNNNNKPASLIIDNSPTNSSPLQSAASSPTSAAAASMENLRCPRCDSANTKFCYYNNYNLTQPRHFCKTCRRYWTKGGALRNVPIGGGCRKTKAAAIPSAAAVKSRASGRPMGSAGGAGESDFLLPSSPILWGGCSTPHSSHLLSLLRASQAQQQNRNTNSILNSIRVKEEGCVVGPQVSALGLDPWGQLCNNNNNNNNNNNDNNSWRNETMYQNQNLFLGDAPTSSGIQELYQRLRAPGNRSGSEHLIMGNNVGSSGTSSAGAAMTTATAASLLEPMPLSALGGDFGYWNPGMAWADLQTTNGAFP